MDADAIRNIAQKTLQETALTSIPVEIVAIANFYGFEVFELNLDPKTSGMIIVSDEDIQGLDVSKAILLNANESNRRKRFTIAHELGHYLLEGNQRNCFAHREVGDYSPEEKAANQFAVELLMPRERVEAFVKACRKSVYGPLPDNILISRVAEEFNLSAGISSIRLESLNLI